MLDPRIYRAALLPVVFALIMAAFSLSDRPRPIGTTFKPETFSQERAMADLSDLARRFPARRPGDSGDAAMATALAGELRSFGSYQVSTPTFDGETVDGKRTLTTVIARQVGQPGPGLVVVSHRDALHRGSRAELSGTAAMLELARILRGGRLHRTVTFVSTSGGSGGLAGARDLVHRLTGSTDAVIALGDVAGRSIRRPFVVGWSTGDGVANLQLRRTLEAALRTNPGGARASSQWARLAFPVTVSEQGPLVAADLPAALLSVGGERPPRPEDPVTSARMDSFGRAALRALTALDNGPDISGPGSTHGIVTLRKVLPVWAVRLLIAALLLAPLLVTVDGLARVRRRHGAIAPWLWWIGAMAVAFTWLLGFTGLLPATPPEPVAAGAIAFDGVARVAVGATVLVALLGWFVLRPAVLRRALQTEQERRERRRFEGEGAGIALLVVWCGLALVLWLTNPYQAALMVPGAHVLLAVVAPEVRLRRALALVLVAVAALPFLLVDLSIAGQLGLSPGEFAWFCVLLVAGGIVGPLGWVVWSLVLVSLFAAVLLAMRGRPARAQEEVTEVTMRGPLSYAGPGSLGGTESALRR
jgi:hypothetical protein